MIVTDGPDGVAYLPADREPLRLTHVLTEFELSAVNKVMRQHRVNEFTEPCQVADVVRRVRHFDNEPREHVLRELERVLEGSTEAKDV